MLDAFYDKTKENPLNLYYATRGMHFNFDRASPVTLHLHLHLLFIIRYADADVVQAPVVLHNYNLG